MSFKSQSQAQLQRHIRQAALSTERVMLTTHAKRRMRVALDDEDPDLIIVTVIA